MKPFVFQSWTFAACFIWMLLCFALFDASLLCSVLFCCYAQFAPVLGVDEQCVLNCAVCFGVQFASGLVAHVYWNALRYNSADLMRKFSSV